MTRGSTGKPAALAEMVPGSTEFLFTPKDFGKIAAVLHGESGIALADNKTNLVYSRLAKRLRALGLRSFAEYCALIEDPSGRDERNAMIAALTTNVTRFFREPHHFAHLKSTILPGLIAGVQQGTRLRIWSSACSSGQEPYSIALTLLSLLPNAARYDIKILGTDIDPNMLAIGAAGIYDETAIASVPAPLAKTYFAPANDGSGQLRANDELRALVSFRSLNLVKPWPMKGCFQAIFCRNVAIYFENETQETIWSRMVPLLDRAGALYIGHSERVTGPAAALLRGDGITTYRPVTGSAP